MAAFTTSSLRVDEEYSTKTSDNLVLVQSRAITALFTQVRDKNTDQTGYVHYADRLMRILAEEGLAHMNSVSEKTVHTPCGPYKGLETTRKICAVSIMRSGDILLEAVRRVDPRVTVGKILIQRDEADPEKRPKLFYSKLPPDVAECEVLLCDPMLATGGSAICAVSVLIKAGVKPENLVFLNTVCCPEGISAFHAKFPQVKIVTLAIDDCLNDDKYIVPGLGDFGDRYFGTL
uniref:uracil phosphoribosyltransferase n=1 Tax=Aplanochytrium stocchinoi TaxID=215587 RepID=A0A7S3V2X3_9STRA|mmetsp:Transcript_5323/g.6714  ORF Transcript_5323/g.6714 Transcript_5323/m.6714 type:complete len:233 (+) Transcript_5323:161-859(+)|eukprot:CAMPEP_0204844402 /NCGR_PEP_ID=MMETSP1347-20130617/194_1 /ASSEMBLY_ACC=CAM_ASM_000690 /TAXON_ID=215587 /ORGANISM="Aplanochytrium stocchinoi, Strain GSBS06" /LENGTH=232 /DNA_ID=CAMNT_0051983753 /DNA_START=64 /DNA_END=762 /DNA_ORIENTATION=-